MPAWSATDYYLKLGGVEGEAATAVPAEPVPLAAWSFGASNPSTVRVGSVAAPHDPGRGWARNMPSI
jgi:hypothetical protein